jgi:hypothetical protein
MILYNAWIQKIKYALIKDVRVQQDMNIIALVLLVMVL